MANELGPVRVGIDTGGTFTDFVVAIGSRNSQFKVPSTPNDPAEAILTGIRRIATELRAFPSDIVHGTTVATNALLERKGACTALITTEGFEDVIEIGRQARPEIYNFMVSKPAPLVDRQLRFGIRERVDSRGAVLEPLNQDALTGLVDRLAAHNRADRQIESAAVSLLFSFVNPAHEQAIASALEPLNIPISLSHEILPEYREYERTATVVINAYLVPLMSRYLESLARGLGEFTGGATRVRGRLRRCQPSLRVMQSNGGSVSASTAAREPVRAILSGPAGGVVGALRVAARAGFTDIITFDMGGTSTDVALCQGEARTTNEATVAGLPVAVPVIDIHTVGAGGGSIARIDYAGAMRVGPESAGADPGPACYGRGELPTVTDANLMLGRFGGASLLGGEMPLDQVRTRQALARLAKEMSRFGRAISPDQAALGIVRVANANMEAALRVVSVERGKDPRLFTLVCFGGAGGLHACELAASLRIPSVLVPDSPGTLSALGVLLGDIVKDYSRTTMLMASQLSDARRSESVFKELEQRARRDLAAEGFSKSKTKLIRTAALRYVGQSFEIEVPWSAWVVGTFHSAHRERYGYADESRPTEIVSLRVRGLGITEKPRLSRSGHLTRSRPEPFNTHPVVFEKKRIATPVYRRESLTPGARISGPAVITEYSSTTLVPPNWRLEVDPARNLLITRRR
jgi:N-methylhydantoinase A